MKYSERIEEIRNQITDTRSELFYLKEREDGLFKEWISPSEGALTCALQSLYDAFEEVQKWENKWGK